MNVHLCFFIRTTSSMKKIILVVFLNCFLGLFFYSCCGDYAKDKLITGSRGFQIFDVEGGVTYSSDAPRTANSIDTIVGEFMLREFYEIGVVFTLPSSNLAINTAYALSCEPGRVLNPIDSSLVKLSFNKAIELHGNSIPANTDLMKNQTVKEYITVNTYPQEEFWEPVGHLDVYFDSTFHADVIIPTGNLNINLTTEGSDGTVIQSSLETYIDW